MDISIPIPRRLRLSRFVTSLKRCIAWLPLDRVEGFATARLGRRFVAGRFLQSPPTAVSVRPPVSLVGDGETVDIHGRFLPEGLIDALVEVYPRLALFFNVRDGSEPRPHVRIIVIFIFIFGVRYGFLRHPQRGIGVLQPRRIPLGSIRGDRWIIASILGPGGDRVFVAGGPRRMGGAGVPRRRRVAPPRRRRSTPVIARLGERIERRPTPVVSDRETRRPPVVAVAAATAAVVVAERPLAIPLLQDADDAESDAAERGDDDYHDEGDRPAGESALLPGGGRRRPARRGRGRGGGAGAGGDGAVADHHRGRRGDGGRGRREGRVGIRLGYAFVPRAYAHLDAVVVQIFDAGILPGVGGGRIGGSFRF